MKQSSKESGEKLIWNLMQTFTQAYLHRAHGRKEDELVVSHAIIAAGCLMPKLYIDCHERAIRSACAAYEKGVPLFEAEARINGTLRRRLRDILAELEAKAKRKKRRQAN